MTSSPSRAITSLTLAALAVTALPACTGTPHARSVTVLAPLEGSEGEAFQKILEAFTAETGIQVNYQGTRAFSEVLLASVQGGSPPDIAILPSVGDLARYAYTGDLLPLDDVLPEDLQDTFPRQWLLPLSVKGTEHIHAVAVKANLKSLVWYNPRNWRYSAPRTWGELVEGSRKVTDRGGTPWCMGMADGPASGWPGTDLIEDILLHQSGVEDYQRWAAGTLPWTSSQVKRAWLTWGELATPKQVRGGPHAALLTDFQDAGRPLFDSPPGCFLEHQASFIMSFYQKYRNPPTPGTDFNFFPFPSLDGQPTGSVWEASADLAGMFRDSDNARRLIRFLGGAEVPRIWAANIEGAFSVQHKPDLSLYHDPVSKRIARTLASERLCFDAADVMPTAMRTAFYRAVLEYLNNPDNSTTLSTLLGWLDQIRRTIPPEDWVNLPCGP